MYPTKGIGISSVSASCTASKSWARKPRFPELKYLVQIPQTGRGQHLGSYPDSPVLDCPLCLCRTKILPGAADRLRLFLSLCGERCLPGGKVRPAGQTCPSSGSTGKPCTRGWKGASAAASPFITKLSAQMNTQKHKGGCAGWPPPCVAQAGTVVGSTEFK